MDTFYNPLGERFQLSFSLVANWLWLQQHWIVMRHLWVVLWISVLVKCFSLQKQKKCAKNASLRRFWHFACDGHEPLLSRQQWCEEELQFLGISTVQRTTCVCWLYHIDPRVSSPPDIPIPKRVSLIQLTTAAEDNESLTVLIMTTSWDRLVSDCSDSEEIMQWFYSITVQEFSRGWCRTLCLVFKKRGCLFNDGLEYWKD